jgi:hypothetical protein
VELTIRDAEDFPFSICAAVFGRQMIMLVIVQEFEMGFGTRSCMGMVKLSLDARATG